MPIPLPFQGGIELAKQDSVLRDCSHFSDISSIHRDENGFVIIRELRKTCAGIAGIAKIHKGISRSVSGSMHCDGMRRCQRLPVVYAIQRIKGSTAEEALLVEPKQLQGR